MALPLLSEINLENQDYEVADAAARERLTTIETSYGQAGGIPKLDENQYIKSENLNLKSSDIPTTLEGSRTFTDIRTATMTASGKVSAKEVAASGLVSGANMTATTKVTTKDLEATGTAKVSALQTTRNATVGGTLGVTGKTTLAEVQVTDLTATNSGSIKELTATNATVGTKTKTAALEVTGTATVKNAEVTTSFVQNFTAASIELGKSSGIYLKKAHVYEDKEITDAAGLLADIRNGNWGKYNPGNYVKLANYGSKITGYSSGAHAAETDLKVIFADFDHFYGGYNNYAVVNTHHIACVIKGLPGRCMNQTGDTNSGATGGYINTGMHGWLKSNVLPQLQAGLQAFFGDEAEHCLSHKKILSKAINSTGSNRFGDATGCVSGWGDWTSEQISLLSEAQLYGTTVWSSSGYDTGEANKQLELFRLKRFNQIFGNVWFFLRDVASASNFAIARDRGDADCGAASHVYSHLVSVPLILLT